MTFHTMIAASFMGYAVGVAFIASYKQIARHGKDAGGLYFFGFLGPLLFCAIALIDAGHYPPILAAIAGK